jgi:hypothetical protein
MERRLLRNGGIGMGIAMEIGMGIEIGMGMLVNGGTGRGIIRGL